MSEQWMRETMELIDDAENRRDSLRDKLGQLQEELAELDESIIAWHKLIAVYQEKHSIPLNIPRDIRMTDFASKSYPEMLIAIAQDRQGYLRVADAVDILFKADVGKDRQSIRNGIYAALNRMAKHFTRIAPGQYRYINHRQEKSDGKPSGIRQAVKELKESNPQMTKKDILNHLKHSGFNFKGKRPMNSINMAWAYLGYSKEGKQQSLPGVS